MNKKCITFCIAYDIAYNIADEMQIPRINKYYLLIL